MNFLFRKKDVSSNTSTTKPVEMKKKRKFKMPSSFAILFGIITFLVLLTWILHWSGVTTQVKNENNGQYEDQQILAMGVLDIFYSVLASFKQKGDLILFIFVIGAYIFIMSKSKTLDAGFGWLIKKMKNKELWLIPPLMLLFAIGGTTFGMAEETIPFYLILIPVFISAGFDAMTGFMTIMLGAGIGTAGSILNPFKIPIAVEAINSSLGFTAITNSTGIAFRVIGFVLLTTISILFVLWYARRVKKDKNKSTVYDLDGKWNTISLESIPELTTKRKASFFIFISSFIVLIVCLLDWDSLFNTTFFADLQLGIEDHFPYFERSFEKIGVFGYVDMAFIFLVGTIIIYLINRNELKSEGFFKIFFAGACDLFSVSAIIVVAAGVGYILKHSYMQELVVNALNSSLAGLHRTLFIFLTFILFFFLSFLIPSSSGFAGAIFPIFGPTAYSVGLASGSITAFTYTSGAVNILSPTSGIFAAATSAGKIPMQRYWKTTWPLLLAIGLVSITLCLVGSAIPSSLGLF